MSPAPAKSRKKTKLDRMREQREAAEQEAEKARQKEIDLLLEQEVEHSKQCQSLTQKSKDIRERLHRLRVTVVRKRHGIEVRTKQIAKIEKERDQLLDEEKKLMQELDAVESRLEEKAAAIRERLEDKV